MLIFTKRLLSVLFCYVSTSLAMHATAQKVTARPGIDIGPDCGGFYESVPDDYSSSDKKYPLMIFLHGAGETGNGTSDLYRIINLNAPPRYFSEKRLPNTFSFDGNSYSFIMIAPQFKWWPNAPDVDAVLEYAVKNYRVDADRIYVTGLSMGGRGTWAIAGDERAGKKLAAIVPICGASQSSSTEAYNIAQSNIPVWATTNDRDPIVYPQGTIDFVNEVNQLGSNKSLAKLTVFESSSHDAWTGTYDPRFRENGMNVYEWMLSKSKTRNISNSDNSNNSINIILPVVLKSFTASMNGKNVLLNWKTTAETNNNYFTLERSSNGTDFIYLTRISSRNNNNGSTYSYLDENPSSGLTFYRLSQTDIDGKSSSFEPVKIWVGSTAPEVAVRLYPNPVPGQLNIALNLSEMGLVRMSIVSSDGRLVENRTFNKQQTRWSQQLDVTRLKPGYYMVKMYIGEKQVTTKFIKN